jgi:hypothetical protein
MRVAPHPSATHHQAPETTNLSGGLNPAFSEGSECGPIGPEGVIRGCSDAPPPGCVNSDVNEQGPKRWRVLGFTANDDGPD